MLHKLIRFRAVILLTFTFFLLLGPIPNRADIIAAVLAYSFLSFVCATTLTTLVFGHLARKNIDFQLLVDGSSSSHSRFPLSFKPLSLLFRISQLTLPPFFHLRVEVSFMQYGVKGSTHLVVGALRHPRHFEELIKFPHRGRWDALQTSFSLEDQFGLSSYCWTEPCPKTIMLSAGSSEESSLPVLSSSFRTGDESPHTEERLGEPFDLKPYHPSDGMRKLLWKVYAKTGELISRHPERSMTPEGRVALFVLAEKQHDHLCAQALSYIEKLDDLNIELLVGCLGINEGSFATTPEQSEQLFMDSVWNATLVNAQEEIASFIQAATSNDPNSSLSQVVIFVDSMQDKSCNVSQIVENIGTSLEQLSILPTYVAFHPTHLQNEEAYSSSSPFRRLIHSILINQEHEPSDNSSFQLKDLEEVCARRSWELFSLESRYEN